MFASVKAETWEQLRASAGRLGQFIYRGQAASEWGLQSSLERIATAGATPFDLLPNREAVILRQFQRRAHLVISSPPPAESRLEWLAILQHHGGPTRLVDFTSSLYVAAFFAIDACAPCDAAIWAVNSWLLFGATKSWNGDATVDEMNARHIEIVEKILAGASSDPGVLHVQPERLNERMSIQKGTFLFPRDVTKPVMENIAATYKINLAAAHQDPGDAMSLSQLVQVMYTPKAPVVVKIVLPRSIHEEILSDLQAMNITAQTLFPGLDGFARSLSSYLRMPEYMRQKMAAGKTS